MDELIWECRTAYDKKDYSRLEWVCNQILEGDSENEIAMTYKMYVYCSWRQHHLVSSIAEDVYRLYPKNVHAFICEAMAYNQRQEFGNALECCEEGLKIKNHKKLQINKIESLICLDRIDEAYEFYKSSKIPGYTFTEALINCSKYRELPEYGEVIPKGELVECFSKRCRHLDRLGKRKEILEVCDEIFKIDKNNEFALEYKICSLQFLDMDDEALKCCNHAIELYPDNYRFLFAKAETLLWAVEDIDGAIECYERGLSMAGDFEKHWYSVDGIVTALYEKADRLSKSANYPEAVEAYDRILFYRPLEFKALENIESLVSEHNLNHEKSKHCRKALKLKENARKRSERIDDCLSAIEIGEYDEDYINGLAEFKDYSSIDEYIRDLIIYLMETYPERSEETARHLVKCHMEYIKSSYEDGEPVVYSSIEVGYCCG